jgi:hypothetical protein
MSVDLNDHRGTAPYPFGGKVDEVGEAMLTLSIG